METASANSILRAFERARKTMEKNEQKIETEEEAGFLVRGRPGQQRGYQVFVRVVKYVEGGT